MVDLSALTLLRNDPDAAAEMLVVAEKGDVDAQYGMGLIYAEGRGVVQDEVKSYYWLSRAVEQGDEEARLLLHVVAAIMTRAQFQQAEYLLNIHRAAVPAAPGRRKGRTNKRGLH